MRRDQLVPVGAVWVRDGVFAGPGWSAGVEDCAVVLLHPRAVFYWAREYLWLHQGLVVLLWVALLVFLYRLGDWSLLFVLTLALILVAHVITHLVLRGLDRAYVGPVLRVRVAGTVRFISAGQVGALQVLQRALEDAAQAGGAPVDVASTVVPDAVGPDRFGRGGYGLARGFTGAGRVTQERPVSVDRVPVDQVPVQVAPEPAGAVAAPVAPARPVLVPPVAAPPVAVAPAPVLSVRTPSLAVAGGVSFTLYAGSALLGRRTLNVPSREALEQLRAVLARVTDAPIQVQVYSQGTLGRACDVDHLCAALLRALSRLPAGRTLPAAALDPLFQLSLTANGVADAGVVGASVTSAGAAIAATKPAPPVPRAARAQRPEPPVAPRPPAPVIVPARSVPAGPVAEPVVGPVRGQVAGSRAEELQRIVAARGIRSLLHFTRLENLEAILTLGLHPRASLTRSGVPFTWNDDLRLDGRLHATSVSVSWPNYRMLYAYRQSSPATQWVILRLSPELLYETDCGFSPVNAASHTMRGLRDDDLKSHVALEGMFAQVGTQRRAAHLPVRFPTDPQAEVLVFGHIRPEHIVALHFQAGSLLTPQTRALLDGRQVVRNSEYYTPRTDYRNWS